MTMNVRSKLALVALATAGLASLAVADDKKKSPAETHTGAANEKYEAPGQRANHAGCKDLPSADDLKKALKQAATSGEIGGLAGGQAEWAAVVDRSGNICAVAVSTDDPTAAWPGSQSIAKAKAYTANAFSTDKMPMSTARLYTMAQPGHTLYGAAQANPINPLCLQQPEDKDKGPKFCGGTIVFGGGVPLYKGKTRVGGLGASGDTPCADHEMAKRMRDKLGFNPEGGAFVDDIWFTKADGPSPFAHPLCKNTWRNGKKLGDEAPASGY
jgi:uncharacterized protein GlcG (DUF336 family)